MIAYVDFCGSNIIAACDIAAMLARTHVMVLQIVGRRFLWANDR